MTNRPIITPPNNSLIRIPRSHFGDDNGIDNGFDCADVYRTSPANFTESVEGIRCMVFPQTTRLVITTPFLAARHISFRSCKRISRNEAGGRILGSTIMIVQKYLWRRGQFLDVHGTCRTPPSNFPLEILQPRPDRDGRTAG